MSATVAKMNFWRIIALVLGLTFFLALAVLAGVMAKAASSIKPLVVMWLLVPAPLVFLLLLGRPTGRAVRLAGSMYLGAGSVLSVAVLFAVAWIGSQRALHPRPCEELPQLVEYPRLQARVQEVWFKSRDGTNLAGWFIPGQRKTTVLLLHGYRCQRDEMLPHADMLHRAGYTLFLFDFRSRGQSEGEAVTLGYHERGDVLGAIDYLKTRPDVEAAGFGVLGISQGGASAILAAAANQEVKAVAAESTFKSLDSVIAQSFQHFIKLPAFPFASLTVWVAERRVGIKSEEIVPEREVRGLWPRPVFIMHGAEDKTISPKDGEAIYAAARQPKEFWLIQGSAHAQGAKKAKAEYEQRIVAFFNSYLK